MPGPVSDSYDSEWGTSSNCGEIKEALDEMYEEVSAILGHVQPMYILDLVRAKHLDDEKLDIEATLTEWEWRIIRFALERAKDSL